MPSVAWLQPCRLRTALRQAAHRALAIERLVASGRSRPNGSCSLAAVKDSRGMMFPPGLDASQLAHRCHR